MPAGTQDILKALETAKEPLSVDGLRGGAKALLLANLARMLPHRALLIITTTADRARQLIEDFKLFGHSADFPRLKLFPESQALPYSHLSPEPEDWAWRIWLLHQLSRRKPLLLIAPVTAVMRRTPPQAFISGKARTIKAGEEIDIQELASYLSDHGYEDVGLVEDVGSFARRGGIVDLWSPTTDEPVRLELDGERIASMRHFDPANQRSRQDLHEVTLLPARDMPFDADSRMRVAHRIRERAAACDLPARERRQLIEYLHEGLAFSGMETLMPLFHEATSSIFDYLPPEALVINEETTDVESSALAHHQEVTELAAETTSPERIVPPEEIILNPEELGRLSGGFAGMRFNAPPTEAMAPTPLRAEVVGNTDLRSIIVSHKKDEDMLAPLIRRIGEWQDQGWHVILTCHTSLQAERLTDLFRWQGIELVPFDAPFETLDQMAQAAPRIRIGRLSAGFRWAQERLAVITDEEIFGGKVAKRAPVTRPMEPFTSFAELAEGDFLVHEQHGIGRYRGLSHLVVNDTPGDYLLLEYLGGDKLYLPVWRLNLVGRYIGAGDTPPLLDRLGGTRWGRIQKKVREDIRLIAKELLEIYASRQVYPGFPFPGGGHELDEFAAAFPYDETPDQAQAIDDVMGDMAIERPMDRLICGDVGYGKTEVAMRAAFRAATGGKQVAVVVPTTVLALQHYETFTDRFAETPIAIEMLSRFRSPKERKVVIDNLRRGTVDIVIGTHRLLQKDVGFKNLGLLIIDEEQRFGVRHKERIKKLRSTVDVITLSATPIPRTLNQSLIGIRDISIINTPPADRLSISTFVAPFDEIMVRQAILKEMGRGGQVFFVHNRVETMASMHDRLKRLVPEARIVVGHGQMKERELEKVMIEFVEGQADVLLATAIIESGLDIPRANTIIINRADTFGLAQLYQLRGRVGRSNVRAYAYLLTPPEGIMTTMAKKRLTVLKRFTELGSGFQIAMHDLEFRGAGNLLGRAQSGHVGAVGYELYTKLLDRAVRKLSGKKVEEEIDPEINLKVAAFLPEDYVPEPPTRIDLYRRMASRETAAEMASLGEELADRFGPLPEEAKNLLEVMEIKILARKLRIRQITFEGGQLSCRFDATSPLETQRIVKLTVDEPGRYRLVPPDKLTIQAEDVQGDAEILAWTKNTLSQLIGYVSETSS